MIVLISLSLISIFAVNTFLIWIGFQYCLIIGIVIMSHLDLSDSEFSDAGEDNEPPEAFINDSSNKVNKNGVKLRGPDKAWVDVERFPNAEEYEKSEIASKLKREFSLRKNREYEYADVLEYECKFKRRVGYKPCPLKMRVSFLSHNTEVRVEGLEDLVEHVHEEDLEILTNTSSNYRWTDEMTKIISNHAFEKPNQIKRLLKNANVFVGRKLPTQQQLYNKVAATRKQVLPSKKVRNTNELRVNIADYLGEPKSDVEAFVPFYEIDDEEDDEEPRFIILFSSKKNLKKLTSDRVLQTDATYRLNWQGFPVWVVGML